MLSKNQVVAVRKAIEASYIGICTVTEYREKLRENKSTGFGEEVVLLNQPCRLSFERIVSANPGQVVTELAQGVKVLIAPDINIKPGSKLTITQNGAITEYRNSGEAAMYATHQEVMLDLFERWA